MIIVEIAISGAISGLSIGKQASQYPLISLSHHSSPITLDSIFDLCFATSHWLSAREAPNCTRRSQDKLLLCIHSMTLNPNDELHPLPKERYWCKLGEIHKPSDINFTPWVRNIPAFL